MDKICVPVTPPRELIHPSVMQHSPFSDYFTDGSFDDCKPDYPPPMSTHGQPTIDQGHLLARLEFIGARISRDGSNARITSRIQDHLDAIDMLLAEPEVVSREIADVADSGLFIDDGEAVPYMDTAIMPSRQSRAAFQASDGKFLKEAQSVLANVTKLSAQMKLRYEEVKHINDLQALKLEDTAHEVLQMRAENEELRTDLSFDHSELLFLKLQLKALEVQSLPHLNLAQAHHLHEGVERWKLDWEDVDRRLRDRRGRYDKGAEIGSYKGSSKKTHDEDGFGLIRADGDGAEFRAGVDYQAHVKEEARHSEAAHPNGPSEDYSSVRRAIQPCCTVSGKGRTTGSPSPLDPKPDVREAVPESSSTGPARSPLQELWAGLTALAGIYDYE